MTCRGRDGKMVLRWASALLMTEKNFCRLMAYQDLWVLKAASGRNQEGSNQKAA